MQVFPGDCEGLTCAGFDGVNQIPSPLDGYSKALYDESRGYVQSPRTLVVDTFLKIFPFSKIN